MKIYNKNYHKLYIIKNREVLTWLIQILGLPQDKRNFEKKELKDAFRAKARTLHPDSPTGKVHEIVQNRTNLFESNLKVRNTVVFQLQIFPVVIGAYPLASSDRSLKISLLTILLRIHD